MFKQIKKERAFTLIELLVVISIIGILSSIVLSSLNIARSKARDSKRIQDFTSLKTALELYYDDHNRYPFSQYLTPANTVLVAWDINNGPWLPFGLVSPDLSVELKPYISSMPQDPISDASSNRYYIYYEGKSPTPAQNFLGGYSCVYSSTPGYIFYTNLENQGTHLIWGGGVNCTKS